MKRFSGFLLGIFLGAAGMFVGMNYHLVRSKDGFHLVPKLAAKFEQPYVDIRSFNLRDWQNHQSLAAAIVKANKSNLMEESTLKTFRETTKGILDKFGGT